jgi:uncharacterized protein
MTLDSAPDPQRKTACSNCGKPATPAHRPFCSARCRSIDLGRWLRGVYRVETDELPGDEAGDVS